MHQFCVDLGALMKKNIILTLLLETTQVITLVKISRLQSSYNPHPEILVVLPASVSTVIPRSVVKVLP